MLSNSDVFIAKNCDDLNNKNYNLLKINVCKSKEFNNANVKTRLYINEKNIN